MSDAAAVLTTKKLAPAATQTLEVTPSLEQLLEFVAGSFIPLIVFEWLCYKLFLIAERNYPPDNHHGYTVSFDARSLIPPYKAKPSCTNCCFYRSSQEAWKALAALFEDSRNPQNLPDEAISTIEAYVAKHHDLEDKDAPQIQHELLDIHSAYVVPYADKRPMFLQLLHLLRPCIKEQSRVEEWWTLVLEPIVNGIGCKKIEIQRASDFLIGALDYDSEGEDKQQDLEVSSYLTDTLLTAWLRRTRVPSPEQETLTMEDQYIARQLEYILVEFGRRKPKVSNAIT